MSLADLRAPRTERVCVACKSFVAECMAPVGEGSAAMCWLCAHHIVDHGVPLHEAMTAECDCKPEDVYPVRVRQALAIGMAHADNNGNGRLFGHLYNPKTGALDTYAFSEDKTGPVVAWSTPLTHPKSR